jgi:hypothetical protein
MRGAGRPASAAAFVMAGAMWSPITSGPAQTVVVPSASSPAIRSIVGPRAETSTDGGVLPGTSTTPAALRASPRGPNVSMEDIAHAAGLGVGTLYRHFPDRRALLLDIAAGALRDLLEFGTAALAREDTAWQALVAIVRFCAGLPLALAKSLAETLPAGTGLPELEQESNDLFARVVRRAQQGEPLAATSRRRTSSTCSRWWSAARVPGPTTI